MEEITENSRSTSREASLIKDITSGSSSGISKCGGASLKEITESNLSISQISRLVCHWAHVLPTAPAILAPGRQPLTYQSLVLEIEQVRETLSSYGICERDRVVSVLPDGPEAAVAFLSVTSFAVFAPLNPAYRENEFNFYLKDLDAKLVMVPQGSRSPAVTAAEKLGISILQVATQDEGCAGQLQLSCHQPLRQADLASDGPGDLALILYTSGTASRPKQVGLTQRNICSSARNIAAAVQLTEQDKSISVMPLFHIHGLSVIYASMSVGGSVVFPGAFSVDLFFDNLLKYQPTWYTAAPSIHHAIYDSLRSNPCLLCNHSLRFIRSASASMPGHLMTNLEKLLQVPFIEAYGMTEAGPQIASNRLPPFERREGSVGMPAGPEVAIVNELGERLPPLEQGEVVVRGENVARFISDDVENNANSLEGGWCRSGDVGYLDGDGYLFITGRLKEIINRGGEKISPREVDQCLEMHPAIKEAASFGVPHLKLGEHVAAAVVLKEYFQKAPFGLVEDIQHFLAQQLAPFKVPQQILFVEAIPKGATGKLQRNRLLELFNNDSSALQIDQKPTDSVGAECIIAAKLSEIWAAVLHIPRPGMQENFFQLGGHSLTAVQVMQRIKKVFQIELPVDRIFDHPTIRQLSSFLGQEMARLVLEGRFQRVDNYSAAQNGSPSLETIERNNDPGPFPLSFSQQRLWFLDQMETGGAYHMDASLYLLGPLDHKILEDCINEMRRRHESLRTVFRATEDDPVQYVLLYEEQSLPLVDLSAGSSAVDDSDLAQLSTEEANRPFDLSQGSLFRTKLVQLEGEKHVLLMSMHHIISDGWSVGILFKELAETYEALVNKLPVVLPDLPIRFADYVAWQRQQLEGPGLQQDILYWKQKLKDLAPLNSFPSDKPRPVTQTFNAEKLKLLISKEKLDSVRAFSESEGVTLFMTCLAAFHVVQLSFTGNHDCVLGIPIAHRTPMETEGLIGFFANTLVLRNDLSGDPSFKELLTRVRKTALEAFAHQNMPFEKLVNELQPSRNLGHTPLFQVMFAYQNFARVDSKQSLLGSDFRFTSELSATPLVSDRSSSKFDLTIYLSETDQGLQTSWHFNTDLYYRSTIEGIATGFSAVLKSMISHPERTVSAQSLRLLSNFVNRESLGVGLDNTPSRFDSFTQLFESQAQETPDSAALVCWERQFTYQRLNEWANQMARHFEARGVTRNSLVGIYLPRSADHLAAILAVWKLGGAYLSLDPSYPVSRLSFMLEDAELEFLVSDDSLLKDFDARLKQRAILSLDAEQAAIVQKDTSDLHLPVAAEDLAYVIYTSGSTGVPKGVMISHGNVVHYTNALRENLEIGPGDRYLHTASFSFSSSVRQFAMPLSCGAMLCLADNNHLSDPGLLFQWVAQQMVSVIDLIPSYWRACIQVLEEMKQESREGLLQNHLRLCLSASEPLPSSIPETWMYKFKHPARFINMYGQTETSGIVSVFPIPSAVRDFGEIVPIGSPIKISRMYLLNEFMEEVPEGTPGEVYVGGAGVGSGYRRDAELTSERFLSDPFSNQTSDLLYRTGDLACCRSDGTLEILGRVDEQIKVRGFRIEPAEIEAAIRRCPGVAEGVVLAVASCSDDEAAKRLVAFAIPASSEDSNFTTEELRLFLSRQLPRHMVPSFIHSLGRLPRTPNGKVDKKELVTIWKSLSATLDKGPIKNADTHLTMVERELLKIWKEVIGLKELGINENYFEVGGDSLLSIRIVNRGKNAGLCFSLKQLFQFQTIRELASVVSLAPNDASREPAVKPEPPKCIESSPKASSIVPDESILVSLESLRAYGHEALIESGLDPQGAKIVTEVQLEASLRGQKTHHVVSIPRYARRIAQGVLNPRPNIRILKETPVSALIDGDNGPGQWVAYESMKTAISKAKESGIGIVSALHSNHLGATGHYAWMATCEGLIGMCTTNGPVVLAPTGGVTPTFGNNPLGVGFPVEGDEPILVDFAMSVAPRSRIGLQVAEGKELPLGWILDKFGRHTTQLDDLASGLGVPIGEHKGYGLAMVMEVLSGVLSGAGFCLDHSKPVMKQKVNKADFGHFFMAINPALFMPLEEFKLRIAEMVSQVKQGDTALGVDEIRIPGEAEFQARSHNLENGVPLTEAVLRTLEDYAQEVGLSAELVFLRK